MNNLVFRWLTGLRQNYWFLPSTMTFLAVLLGFLLPYLDWRLGSDWIQAVGFLRATQVEGARAILTTLSGATLGVAGVAFSVTIVAVSFASSNYGPRLISNFMGDRTNQVILGVFVATFVYCIIVLSTVHASSDLSDNPLDAFIPNLSIFFALLLMLAAVGALIVYIHHIPESINIMNLTAAIGDKLHCAIVRTLEEEEARGKDRRRTVAHDANVAPSQVQPPTEGGFVIRATAAGFIQQFNLDGLAALAAETGMQITLHRAPGDFIVVGTPIMSARPGSEGDPSLARRLRDCCSHGASRTDVQDLLFLSDQLVEVLGRALSPGVNDPHTAMLCLDWLRAGLVAFAQRPPPRQALKDDAVLYRRVTFEDMLNRSFDEMRQYVAADRTATLHALGVLAELALIASRPAMADACVRQIERLARSANELLAESAARDEVEAELNRTLRRIASRTA